MTNKMQYNFRSNCNSGSPIQPLNGLNVAQPPMIKWLITITQNLQSYIRY